MTTYRRAGGFDRILVVGAGPAGVAAAKELRRAGFHGELVMLCDDPDAPYDRPACTKGILTGHDRPQDVSLQVPDDLDAAWHLGRRAVHLDTRSRVVLTDTDEVYPYDGLVIATGSRAATPAGWPLGGPGVHHIHSLADAWALRADLRHARRVAVLGGGLTGCEVASAVRGLARECVLVDVSPAVMRRALGTAVAEPVTRHLAREGVDLRLGEWVRGIERWRDAWVLHLTGGATVVADVLVSAAGERTETDWLAGSGLDIADGVRCDARLRVLGAAGEVVVDDVVAAGAVARWPNSGGPTGPVRVGQWIAALELGRAAARSLLAGGPGPPVTVVPRFSSDQFGLRIQVCGHLPPDAEVSVAAPGRRRGGQVRTGLVASHRVAGRLVGVVAVNASDTFAGLARTVLDGMRSVATGGAQGLPFEVGGAGPGIPEPGPARHGQRLVGQHLQGVPGPLR